MYIILKGRVVISNTFYRYKDVEKVLSSISEGEEFGQMNLMDGENETEDNLDQYRRQVNAKTVETTFMLRIAVTESRRILRPSKNLEASSSAISISQMDRQSKVERSISPFKTKDGLLQPSNL